MATEPSRQPNPLEHGMQLDWLTTFLEICKTRNFNACAENLGVMQSTVSSRVRALEEVLDARLFVRGRGGAQLTAEGERFKTYAETIVLNWQLAAHDVKPVKSQHSVLRVSVQMSVWEHLVSPWLAKLQTNLPHTSIYLEADYSKTMVRELKQGKLDIAVLYAPEYSSRVEVEPLFIDRFQMISSHPMSIEQVDVNNYVFVSLTDYFNARHREILPHLHPASLTMGLSIMSRAYMKEHGGAAYASERQATKLTSSGEFHLVGGAPVIEQPAFVSYLAKNKRDTRYVQALEALRQIVAN